MSQTERALALIVAVVWLAIAAFNAAAGVSVGTLAKNVAKAIATALAFFFALTLSALVAYGVGYEGVSFFGHLWVAKEISWEAAKCGTAVSLITALVAGVYTLATIAGLLERVPGKSFPSHREA